MLIFLSGLFPVATRSDIFLNKAKKAYKLSGAEEKVKDQKEGPSVLITSPANGLTVNGQINISGRASDNYGVIEISIRINNGEKAVLYQGEFLKSREFEYLCDTTALPNGPLSIRISARDRRNNLAEAVLELIVYNAPAPSRPAAPQWISCVPLSTNLIRLAWHDLSNETGYTLFRNTSNNSNTFTPLASLVANTTNYDDSSLAEQTKYFYRLRAVNGIGASGLSSVISNSTFRKSIQTPTNFRITNNKFTYDHIDYLVKSIALEPFMPGETPLDDPVKLNYTNTLQKIKQLNANTVYLLTGAPSNLQTAFFQSARAEGINIILGLWFSADADDYAGHSGDFQNSYFKDHVKNLIRQFTDKYHNISGTDYSSQIIYATLGNELMSAAINNTTALHPFITSYKGRFVSISNANAVECFLAEMTDYYKTYEAESYGQTHFVTHHTWPEVSPWLMKNSFLDIISYNLYSYWPAFVTGHAGGSSTGTPYQGALEELASYYTNKPFVVSEFGISVASNNVTIGTNLSGQSNEMISRWQDITTANRFIAGGSIHELYDQWWKDDGVDPPPSGPDEDEHDPTDREEYFGLIRVEGPLAAPTFYERPAFWAVTNMFR